MTAAKVFDLIAGGLSNRAIARALGVDEITIRRLKQGATKVPPKRA